MAQTFLEAIGILQTLGMEYLLTPMLVFVVVFGILMKTKAISDKLDLNAVIAFIIAIIVALVPGVAQFSAFFLPMVTVIFIIMFAGVLLFLFFGASTADLGKFFKSPPAWIFFAVIFIVVFMFSIQQAFPQIYPTPEMLANMTTEEGEINPAIIMGPMSFLFTFGNPRVLGVIAFLLLVGIIGIIVVIQTKGS